MGPFTLRPVYTTGALTRALPKNEKPVGQFVHFDTIREKVYAGLLDSQGVEERMDNHAISKQDW